MSLRIATEEGATLTQTSITFHSGSNSSALVKRHLLPVGTAYIAHVRRAINNHTFEQHDELADEARRLALTNGGANNFEDDLGIGDEEESEELLRLDPKEWKVRM